MDEYTRRIRELNDILRRTFSGGRVMLTAGVNALPLATQIRIVAAVQSFDAFNEANDPFAEHDFGRIEIDGSTIYFKIDAYDPNLRFGSEDPSDPARTTRVLTIMLAEEY